MNFKGIWVVKSCNPHQRFPAGFKIRTHTIRANTVRPSIWCSNDSANWVMLFYSSLWEWPAYRLSLYPMGWYITLNSFKLLMNALISVIKSHLYFCWEREPHQGIIIVCLVSYNHKKLLFKFWSKKCWEVSF